MGLKILSWNVNGLRSIHGKGLKSVLSSIGADVICLQETRLSQEVFFDFDYPFQVYNSSQGRKGYSGTGVLAHVPPIHYDFALSVDTQPPEGRIIVTSWPEFLLVNVYTPNSGGGLRRLPFRTLEWDPRFCQFLKTLGEKKPVILCGDLNVAAEEIDLAHPELNHYNAGFTDEEREGFQNYLRMGFVDIFRKLHPGEKNHYTWWSYRTQARQRNVGWRIDYFLVSKQLVPQIKNCSILKEITGSDHAPVLLELC